MWSDAYDWMCRTTSMPERTSPKTTLRLSHHGAGPVVMKNCSRGGFQMQVNVGRARRDRGERRAGTRCVASAGGAVRSGGSGRGCTRRGAKAARFRCAVGGHNLEARPYAFIQGAVPRSATQEARWTSAEAR